MFITREKREKKRNKPCIQIERRKKKRKEKTLYLFNQSKSQQKRGKKEIMADHV